MTKHETKRIRHAKALAKKEDEELETIKAEFPLQREELKGIRYLYRLGICIIQNNDFIFSELLQGIFTY